MPDYIDDLPLASLPAVPGLPHIRHRMVSIGDVRLHVAEVGDPHAPSVLLLHGFPQHWYAWRHLMGPLAGSRHVVAVDFRGFGWSDAPRGGYAVADRVRDVLALMDQLGIVRADLVGHDWGGLVASYVALEHPDRVDRLVSISMLHLWPRQRYLAPSTWRWWVTGLFEWPGLGSWMQRRPRVIGWLMSRDAQRPEVWSGALRETYAARAGQPARARAGRRLHTCLLRALPRVLLGRDRHRDFEVPTMVIGGERDALIPPAVLTVPDARADVIEVRIVPGGHYLLDEAPPEHTAAVLAHLQPEPVRGTGAC